MGNCLICSHKKNNKIVSLEDHDTLDRLFETAQKAAADDAANKEEEEGKKVTRVRVLVTKQELREILNREGSNLDKTSSSLALEELLMRKVKLREFHEMFTSEDDDDVAVANGGWKPALESIPEDS